MATARRPKPPAQPFTLPHFRAWASDLILDTGQSWHPEDFQEWFIEDLFAGIPECWLVVPEGNGKTTLLGGVALYHAEFRPFAEVAVAASSREQAGILYRQAEGFVLRSPRMHESSHSAIAQAKGKRKTDVPRFLALEGYRRINHHEGGRIQIFAADDRTGDGIIPTLGLLDELHRHRDLSLYRTWAGKLAKRQGQLGAISTAGEPGADFELTRERIRQETKDVTRKGAFVRAASTRLVLHEWAVPEDGDVEDMAVVKAANPFSGITADTLAEKFTSPTMTLQHWRRFVCNLPTRTVDAAITEAEWSKASLAAAPTWPQEIPYGQPIWLGLDVAWKWDTTAAVPFWAQDSQHRILGPATVIVPPRDGDSLHPDAVKRELIAIHARNPIHSVVMDTSGAIELAAWISDELGAVVIDRQQTNPLAVDDYEQFMEALRNGWLRHSGDPDLTKHALNAIARVLPFGDARFDRPSQSRSGPEQERRVIDALTAAAMVNSTALIEAEPLGEAMMAWG